MSNCVVTLLSIYLHFSHISNVFINIDLYKLDYSYICPLGKSVMSRH